MTAPTSVERPPLPRDNFRSIIAGLITALTLYGWIDALGRTPLRDALRSQTRLWWIEQIVALALAVVCVGIILRKRSFLGVAFWLTIYSILFDVMRWIFEFVDGQFRIPVGLLLYFLFVWRLLLTRKQVDTRLDAEPAEAPPR